MNITTHRTKKNSHKKELSFQMESILSIISLVGVYYLFCILLPQLLTK